MMEHPYGWLSLLPPIVAIGLAIATRRVVVSLVVGIFAGALVTSDGNLFLALVDTLELHLWRTLTDPGKLRVFSFTLLMGAMIGVVAESGGMRGLVNMVIPWAKTRRRGQMTVWLLGMLVFFDDYANSILLGKTLQPLCDRLRISREKLAYLVDSTAAPVAGLALVSTWVAVEIDYVQEGLDQISIPSDVTAFSLFVASIPYRFYILMSLVMIPWLALQLRDFGPMLAAERRRQLSKDNAPAEADDQLTDKASDRWFNAVVPILVTLIVVVALMVVTGRNALPDTVPANLRNVFGQADSSLALQYGALAGLVVASLLCLGQRLMSFEQIIVAAGKGARLLVPAIAILWCASTMSRMTGYKSVDGEMPQSAYEFRDHRLYSADYLKQLLRPDDIEATEEEEQLAAAQSARTLPTVVFLLAAVVAFCTGTSFGTMGILMPMTIGLADTMLSGGTTPLDASHPILLASVGGVLSGAVFGDHCSPISDTTILSSQASGCDHMAHVWTQLPYALTVAVVSVVFGTLPLGWGVSTWFLLPLQAVALLVIVRWLGQPIEAADRDARSSSVDEESS